MKNRHRGSSPTRIVIASISAFERNCHCQTCAAGALACIDCPECGEQLARKICEAIGFSQAPPDSRPQGEVFLGRVIEFSRNSYHREAQ